MEERLPIVKSHLSKSTYLGLQMIVHKGSHAEKGLGKNLQRMAQALQVTTQANKWGLRFKANAHSRKRQEKRTYNHEMARSLSQEEESKSIMFPSLHEIFHSGGRIDPSQSEEQKAKDFLVILNKAFNNLYLQDTEP